MMMLVVSMPFYSAGALAATVQITKNQGEAGIETYLDAGRRCLDGRSVNRRSGHTD